MTKNWEYLGKSYIYVKGEKVERKSEIRFLGVTMDIELEFNTQLWRRY